MDLKCNLEMGRYSENTPQKLYEFVLNEMKTRDSDINAIIMNGDLVKHGQSINNKNATSK
jgi:hypothetical protein